MIKNPATSFPAGCGVFLCPKTLRGFNGWTALNRTGTTGTMPSDDDDADDGKEVGVGVVV